MGETVQKHLDKVNSAWHELAVTFGRSAPMHHHLPHVAICCRQSRCVLLLKDHCLNGILTIRGGPFRMKGFARPEGRRSRDITNPETARTRRTELGLVERVRSGQRNYTRVQRRQRSWVRTAGSLYDESVHISDH